MPTMGRWKFTLSFFVDVRRRGWWPELLVHGRLRPAILWISRALVVIGWASAFFAFPGPAYALAFAILLTVVQQVFERAILVDPILLVRALPSRYDPREWVAMGFAFPEDSERLVCMGPAFQTVEYAKQFFDALLAWNGGSTVDVDNNICVSLIVETHESYTAFIYPNTESRSVRLALAAMRPSHLPERVEMHEHVMFMTFIKKFPYGADSFAARFINNRQLDSKPYFLAAFQYEDRRMKMLFDLPFIQKRDVKIKNRFDLTPQDMEYRTKKQGNKPL